MADFQAQGPVRAEAPKQEGASQDSESGWSELWGRVCSHRGEGAGSLGPHECNLKTLPFILNRLGRLRL